MSLVREPQKSEILIYQNTDGRIKIDVMLDEETVWLTIAQMAELFQKSRSTVNEHILNIYKEGELEEDASLRKIGNSDFSVKPANYYNLDVIISVGYRVKSRQGTQFRIWATQRLKDWPNGQGWTKWTEGMDRVGVSLCGGFVGFAENN